MAAENDDTAKFEIDGTTYEIPHLADLDLDEWAVVYGYAEVTVRDILPREDEEAEADRMKRLNSPLFTAALVHVAFKRAHADMTEAAIKKEIGKIKMVPLMAELISSVGDDEDENPTSASEPARSSRKNSDDSAESSSPASSPSSETQDEPLAATGTSG